MAQSQKKPVRIANSSGATGDGPDALRRLVRDGPVDIITADYLAEVNIAWLALEQSKDPSKGYEPNFLKQLDKESAEIIAEKKIKLIHNGGALNPKGLAEATEKLLESYGVSLKVAFVEGDNVLGSLAELRAQGKTVHLDTAGRDLSMVTGHVLTCNAYIGMGGVVAALEAGADIIICGRCCDASPVMGAAAWWHGWSESSFDELSGALIAGHCIECGCYATGGNFSGHKSISNNWNQGYPVAEIYQDGTFDIFLQDGARGLVSRDTITAQLVYEIQGPSYLNPDVIADITNANIQNTGKNRVHVSGFTGSPPPPTTKLAICYNSGYQCELSLYAVGLDVAEKLAALQSQIDQNVPNKSDYTVLRIDQYGVPQPDAPSQALATCQLRLFAQAEKPETLATLGSAVGGYGLGGFCGMHSSMDFRTLVPKPLISYEPFRIPYSELKIRANLGGKVLDVPAPSKTEAFAGQKLLEAQMTYEAGKYGPTKRSPLGHIVHARSGDKGSNANVGFWVRHADEYDWLRSLLSTSSFIELLGQDYKAEYQVERFEMPNLLAVHFVVKGILEGGISSTYRLDGLAKSFGEFLRARYVDIPVSFLERGLI
ncbi:duf1446 domain-containing protein [Xylariales sp. AK1849]|nr:duf1446 domain-containing protein [Xylariales sp. AK1849]